MILAVIQPTKLEPVRQALASAGIARMTVCDAQGFGRQGGRTESYRGHEYATRLLRKVAVEIAVNDDYVDRTIEILMQVAKTGSEGNIGDGKIFILPMDDAISLASGQRGPGGVN